MKFIADVMLGRLAKRLRLLGYDVLYDPALDDNGLIRLSFEQHRLILTRDEALAERPLAAYHLFINSGLVEEQLEQVLSKVSRRRVSPHTLFPVQRTARGPAATGGARPRSALCFRKPRNVSPMRGLRKDILEGDPCPEDD